MPFAATCMDPEIVLLSEVSQSEKVKYDITYIRNLKKKVQMNLFTKQKQTHRLRKRTYGCWGYGSGEGIVREFGMDMYTLLDLKWITNKDLLYITGNFAQYFVKT